MTPEQITAIRERAEKAFCGPWIVNYSGHTTGAIQIPYYIIRNENGTRIADGVDKRTSDFIAASISDIPALLADNEQLTAQLTAALQDVSRLTADVERLKEFEWKYNELCK